ncbi:glucuronate isomerase [Halobaculum lipolyticum]|uniref:Uronate isomerase n=1 Tax=Halobaculum lipolyticum TaxID=3032001 RepID=A0ABD5W8B9_9EURY|nr:glucuronate isomerase [Halobaculum sp. DT31]
MSFLDEEYLLGTDAARELYDAIADLPIVDPHSHLDVAELADNERWSDVWAVEGATDHYVWAAMRKRGVPEARITGDASNREKWDALARVMPEIAGNPTYEWIHLDLRRRFGIDTPVSAETADEIWTETRRRLREGDTRPRAMLREMDVETVCSTDDPAGSLADHRRLADDLDDVDVRPTWRADRAVHVDGPEWDEFVDALAASTGVEIRDFADYRAALTASHDRFAEHGCRASDTSLREPVTKPVSDERAAEVFAAARRGESLTDAQVEDFRAHVLSFVAGLDADRDWVTQLHVGPVRNYRDRLYEELGPAAGGTVTTGDVEYAENLRHLLNSYDGDAEFVLYCVDPTHYPSVTTIARAFPNVSVGPAWWYNDSPFGIDHQLDYAGSVDLLANHAGMVSDSRKLPSFGSRFELFRRTLADLLGRYVERGRMPMDVARDLAEHVAYDRPKELYGF